MSSNNGCPRWTSGRDGCIAKGPAVQGRDMNYAYSRAIKAACLAVTVLVLGACDPAELVRRKVRGLFVVH